MPGEVTAYAKALLLALIALQLVATPLCTDALRLRFDPEYSPPDDTLAASRPDLYRAYNKPALSHRRKPIRVFVEDDLGNRITTGANSEIVIRMTATHENVAPSPPAQSMAVYQSLIDSGDFSEWRKVYRLMTTEETEHEPVTLDGLELQASAGVVEFPSLVGLLPTVFITNVSTGEPYAPGLAVLPRTCCKMYLQANTVIPGLANSAMSNFFHVFHRAESLRLATSLPSSVLTDEVLPSLEVHVMTLSRQVRDSSGNPTLMPLLHGADVESIEIHLTVSWDKKIFAGKPMQNISREGIDLSPLLYSAVDLSSPDVVRDFRDDLTVRKTVSLLPSGFYGAIFEGVSLRNASSSVRLNFTMTHVGGYRFNQEKTQKKITPPSPFSRASLGLTMYNRTWSHDTFYGLGSSGYLGLGSGTMNITSGVFNDLYEAHEENRMAVTASSSPLSCTLVPSGSRRSWCLESGFSIDATKPVGRGVLLSNAITVRSRNATKLVVSWGRNTNFKELVGYPFWDSLRVTLMDASDVPVVDGPDANAVLTVAARSLTLNATIALCKSARGPTRLSRGTVVYKSSVCKETTRVVITFSLTTASGLALTVTTAEFDTSATIPIAIMVPEKGSNSDLDLDYRLLRMAFEQPIRGYNELGPHSIQLGHITGGNFKFTPTYINSALGIQQVLAQLENVYTTKRIRSVIGPYNDDNAEIFGDWIASHLPETSHVSLSNHESLSDEKRYPMIAVLPYSARINTVAMVRSIVARQWEKVTIIQSRSADAISELFFSEARRLGVEILEDVNIPSNAHTSLTPLDDYFNTIKAAGARVLFTNLGGDLAHYVFVEAVRCGVTAQNGFHWVGDEKAHRAFNPMRIPNSQAHFDGAMFLTPAYGIDSSAGLFQDLTYTDFQLYEDEGGLDPYVVKQKGLTITDLPPWAMMRLHLAIDAVWFIGWPLMYAMDYGFTNDIQFAYASFTSSIVVPSNAGAFSMDFPRKFDRIGYYGVWVQMKSGNLTSLEQTHRQTGSSMPFSPWQLTTAVDLPREDSDLIESQFTDPQTLVTYPYPTYGTNVTLTKRTFKSRSTLSRSLAVINSAEMVPVTHTCLGGCGGGLVNPLESAYIFANGECVGPNECSCNLRVNSTKPAYIGENCETTSCDAVCVHGTCELVSNDTMCICEPGWEGEACNTAICSTYGCSSSFGSCELPNLCVCSSLYYGMDCSMGCMCKHGICNDGTSGDGSCRSCDSGWIGANCDMKLEAVLIPAIAGGVLFLYILFRAFRWYVRLAKHRALLANMDWKVQYDDIVFQKESGGMSQNYQSFLFHSMRSVKGGNATMQMANAIGVYKGNTVFIERLQKDTVGVSQAIREEIRDMREVHHPNLEVFIGACTDSPNVCILTQFSQKGGLDDILNNPDVRLDWNFKYSMLKDIAKGMFYLHTSVFQSHGRLMSGRCMVDNRWTVKITDFSLRSFKRGALSGDVEEGYEDYGMLRWTAPELLTGATTLEDLGRGSQSGDVYSFGILMSEFLSRQQPYDDMGINSKQIITILQHSASRSQVDMPPQVKKAWSLHEAPAGASITDALRPSVPHDAPEPYKDLMFRCWSDDPQERPSFKEILKTLDKINPQKGDVVDNLVYMLEKYSSDLEGVVAERTVELEKEKKKVEDLLSRMLPAKIVQDLKNGKNIKAESFENVTIFFSDIVGFTRICSQSTPFQVVEMLNDLYTCFDAIVEEHDVYKVETIGDAYMVVSGLPTRNGDKHAGEIATMALSMLHAISNFKIRHLPHEQLQLRIGLHSGPVVAGVVGTKMPRYCLFGDTVNIASRMESNGLALRVHISDTTARLLQSLGGFHIEKRGVREIKGRGQMETSWLLGKKGFDKALPSLDLAASEADHDFK